MSGIMSDEGSSPPDVPYRSGKPFQDPTPKRSHLKDSLPMFLFATIVKIFLFPS